jgi:hypothetical protein
MTELEAIINDLDNLIGLYLTIQTDPDPMILTELSKIFDKLKEFQNAQINNQP